MFKVIATAAALAAAATAASAAAIDFTFDRANSSVTLTPLGGFGSGCTGAGDCVTASLADGFATPATVSVEEGWENRYTFDFLRFDGNGHGLYEGYDVSATLAFSDPVEATTTSGGKGGVGVVLNGYIKSGFLAWDDVPITLALDDGSQIWVDFEDGAGLFLGTSVTTTATIKVKSVAAPAPVPLPAGGLLLLGGLGIFGALRARRAA